MTTLTLRSTGAVLAAIVLAGCSSLSADSGFADVARLTRDRTGQTPTWHRTGDAPDSTRARTSELLGQPLTADAAVELALLHNPGLQASFQELRIAESDLVQAGRLRNPSLGFGRLRADGGTVEIERSVVFDVLGLLAMPLARQVEEQRFEQARLRAAYDAVGLAADTRRAYFMAVAAQETLRYAGQVQLAAEASHDLAARMLAAGNVPKLALLREQAFLADTTVQSARAQQQALARRERLTRLLGLDGSQPAFALPERLPDLPRQPSELQAAEQTAMAQRLDVLMARRSTDALAASLGLTRATRWVDVLQAGYRNKSETGAGRADGYTIALTLPIFDSGDARLAAAEARHLQAVQRTAEIALQARSEVRESYAAYRSAFALAQHYRDDIVPLRKRISEENLLRYNGMLIGPFELLADAREQVASVTAYVEALRDYWVADAALHTAVMGRSPRTDTLTEGAP